MKKTYNPISDVRNESVDLTKRLYRNISDAAHQLDEIRGGARCVGDLFTPTAEVQRARLRDACERLLLLVAAGHPAQATAHAHTRKAEELLWRKVYYDVFATAKRIRKGSNNLNSGSGDWQTDELALVQHHLTSGVGLYHHLLWRLQCECALDVSGIADCLVFFPDHGLKKGRSGGGLTNGVDKMAAGDGEGGIRGGGGGGGGGEWTEAMAHKCLIYLGDLCRYLVDLQPGWDYGLAAHYYTQALLWKPETGLPHNQLGTLAGTQNYSLDAVYHYMRCLCCVQKFEGTEANLNQLLDKSMGLLEANSVTTLARTVARLLCCARTWFCNKPPKLPMHKVCDDLIVDLRECLNAAEDVESEPEPDDIEQWAMVRRGNDKPTRMTEEMLFKSVAILLMCLHNLNNKGSSELSRCMSLQLSMMAQLLQQILLKVESVLPPPRTPPPLPTNGLAANRRRRRMRRRRIGSDDESSAAELSEGEEVVYVSDTDSDASEEKLIFDQNSSDSDEELNGKTANGTDSADEDETVTSGDSSAKSYHYKDNLTFQHLHRLSQQGFLLQTIKICFDWLGSNVDTLKACGQTCKLFLDQAVSFFNHLLQVPFTFDSNNDVNVISNNNDRIVISDDLCPLPLPEDVCLRDLPPLVAAQAQQGIDWKKGLQANISSEQETYLRIYRLLTVGLRLAKDDSVAGGNSCGWSFIGQRKWFVADATAKPQRASVATKHPRHRNHRTSHKPKSSNNAVVMSHSLLRKKNNIYHNGSDHHIMACNGVDKKPADCQQENGVTGGNDASSTLKHNKSRLMANMGQLWLRAEVKELESKVKRTAQHQHLPPYLVLDAEALAAHFPLTKQLVMSKKFIVLVPSVVVSALDEQKKESAGVRETIRWLEGQFRHGNRFVRAQRPNEHLSLPLIKYPKKKDKEAWLFFQIVECCHFLSNQGGKDQGLVTLLTGSPTLLHSSNSTGFSPLGIASTAGINIEHIESFHSKWKSSSKSHG